MLHHILCMIQQEVIQRSQAAPEACCSRRRRVTNATSFGRSCSLSAVNFNPKPAPGLAWRTSASARICPSCTRKSRRVTAPVGCRKRVSMKSPPMLIFRTEETSSRPWHFQYTHTPAGARTREVNRREGAVVGRKSLSPFGGVSSLGKSKKVTPRICQ